MHKYYKGYPACHKRAMWKARMVPTLVLIFFGGLSLVGVVLYIIVLWLQLPINIPIGEAEGFKYVLWCFLAIVFFCIFFYLCFRTVCYGMGDTSKGRVVLYFDKLLPRDKIDEWAFSYGFHLAKNLETFDSYLESKAKLPLSDFGFHDDFWDKRNEWKSPESLLDSMTCLKAGVDSKELMPSPELEKELSVFIEKLEQAIKFQIQCRLMYRNGLDNWIVPMEIEQREGKFP